SDGKETISAPILYAFGQGKAGQTYVFEVQGKLHESRISFYNEINGLDLTLGATREVPQTLIEAIGRPMSSIDVKDCFSCHATAAVSDTKLQLDKMTLGVTCEGCHGPGENHIIAMKSGSKANKQIVNPGHFNADGQTEFCGSCHRTWSQVQLMRIRGVANVRFQPYRIFGSKCYDIEDKRIGCVTCHDPHQQTKQTAVFYDSKCLACHSANAKDVARLVQCRVGKENCASCHMPKYELPGSHFKFTDHRIRVVRPNDPYPD
ncbi:MAG TPA: multiheme c-type cytochrome, partial [Blastocatellia bacterium]|nr:multiheme c-type cytochrome [Blastocatellia bacterium]